MYKYRSREEVSSSRPAICGGGVLSPPLLALALVNSTLDTQRKMEL